MTTEDDFEGAVEEVHAALMRQFPDPVDVFEDDLAEKLARFGEPDMSLEEWRRARVRFIDSVAGAPAEHE